MIYNKNSIFKEILKSKVYNVAKETPLQYSHFLSKSTHNSFNKTTKLSTCLSV